MNEFAQLTEMQIEYHQKEKGNVCQKHLNHA
jgi:hypothetical protein